MEDAEDDSEDDGEDAEADDEGYRTKLQNQVKKRRGGRLEKADGAADG